MAQGDGRGSDAFLRSLAYKHGTGMAARADAAGNHAMVAGITDAYSTNGQVVPAHLQDAMRELNEITQQETLLAKTTGSARAALAGTGYDPLAVTRRAGELENYLMTNSSEARTAMERALLQTAQQQVRALEIQNQFQSETFDARRDATIAELNLSRGTDEQALDALNLGKELEGLMTHVRNGGHTLEDLYDVWEANDPALATQVFGTGDRLRQHQLLRAVALADDEFASARLNAMTKAANLSATQLASDPSITNDMLMQMAAGEIDLPDGATMLSVAAAVEERQGTEIARQALVAAEAQGIVQGKEYEQLMLAAMAPVEIADVLSQVLGNQVTAEQIMEALSSGETTIVATAVMEAAKQGGAQGTIQIKTPTGKTATVTVQAMLDNMVTRLENRELQTAMQLQSSQRFNTYMQELKATQETIRSVEGMIGVPLPAAIGREVENAYQSAQVFMRQAARAPTQEERDAAFSEAQLIMENSREMIVDFAKRNGAPEFIQEDIRQGRFSSDTSFKHAVSRLVGFSDAGLRNHPLGRQWGALLDSKNLSPQQLEQWAADPNSKISDLGITHAEVTQIVHGSAYSVLAREAITAIQSNPAYERLPQSAQEMIMGLANPDTGIISQRDLPPQEVLRRVSSVIRVADEIAYAEDNARVLAGQQEFATYERGTLQRNIQEVLDDKGVIQSLFAPGGKLDRSMGALLVTYMSPITGNAPTGEQSVAFEDIASSAAEVVQQQLAFTMLGAANTDISSIKSIAFQEAWEYAGPVSSMLTNPLDKAATSQRTRDISDAKNAVLSIYARKLADPSRYKTKLFGYDLPSSGNFPGGAGVPAAGLWSQIATSEEISAELRRMGKEDVVTRLGRE